MEINSNQLKIMGKAELPKPLTLGHSECHEWGRKRHTNGYGYIMIKGKCILAHRYMYEIAFGPIPDGLVIDHMCRNRACVNPEHLRAVTRIVNCMENSVAPFALNALKTHCPNGHEYTKGNTYLHKKKNRNPSRECRTCVLERCKEYRKRHANK